MIKHRITTSIGLFAMVALMSISGICQAQVSEVPRRMNYFSEGNAFVCVNGDNRYTRALYGSHTAFRVETSDRPLFGMFVKNKSRHIQFRIAHGDAAVSLQDAAYCKAIYEAGMRRYHLSDPRWSKGTIKLTTLALADADGAIWKIEPKDMPAGSLIGALMFAVKNTKLSRNGDMGVDPADSFDPTGTQIDGGEVAITGGDVYMLWLDDKLTVLSASDGQRIFEASDAARRSVARTITIDTPDRFLNPVGSALALAADGIWDGKTWQHGAIGWRMPLAGWRAAYTGDALGWHDRARTHFNAYAASQVTNVAPVIPPPAQDSTLNLARSAKIWGTPMYSNGYICRNPERNNQMHHYDMNLVYIDELLWHLKWTGDMDYARTIFPTIKLSLAWEKRVFDPDGDGLYNAYACIWASDALYYNSGGVTHSSAYNYRANKLAAEIAELIGEDPQPYRREAKKILDAINARLWLKDKGHWAEFQDFMGNKLLHEDAALWTIYHSLDSDIADPFQAYQATRYVDTSIPHIAVEGEGLQPEGYATVSTTDWHPYSWSINNVAFAEVMHTALAYFQADRPEEGYRLMKSSLLDGMYLGRSPGNFGQISYYDAARGECYRDFGDPIGVASRLVVQGLFGILPDALHGKLLIKPGFPMAWDKASIRTADISFSFARSGKTDRYEIGLNFNKPLTTTLRVRALYTDVASVSLNGQKIGYDIDRQSVGNPAILIVIPASKESQTLEVEWDGVQVDGAETRDGEVYDPQNCRQNAQRQIAGHYTYFVRQHCGKMEWWKAVDVDVEPPKFKKPAPFALCVSDQCETIDINRYFNASVTDIFRRKYWSPRSPYTTLQIPLQGIGEWCHPTLTAAIDDSGLRQKTVGGLFDTGLGVKFRSPRSGKNIAFVSLWDNDPDSVTISLGGKASHAYLMMAGSTNHMQFHVTNGTVRVQYTDGTHQTLVLTNPDNWYPIEQDLYVDGKAFRLNEPRQYRFALKSGLVSNDLGRDLHIQGVYGRPIEGGAGVLLDMALDPAKTLKSMTITAVANEVVIGLMGLTLQR